MYKKLASFVRACKLFPIVFATSVSFWSFESTACVGDCDLSLTVTVDEVVLGVNIALGEAPLSACERFDSNDDSMVTVDELLAAVNAALSGCDDPAAEVISPFQVVLMDSAFASDMTAIRLFDGSGFSVEVPIVRREPLGFVAPFYVDPASGALTSGIVEAEILRGAGSPIPIGRFLVTAPAEPGGAPGQLTRTFIEGARGLVESARDSLVELEAETALVAFEELDSALMVSAGGLDLLDRSGALGSIDIGGDEQAIAVDSEMLAISDRIVAQFLVQLMEALASDGPQHLQRTSAVTGGIVLDDLRNLAANLDEIVEDVSQTALDAGRIASAAAGIGFTLAATTAALTSAPVTATALATIGAFSYLATTFVPVAAHLALKLGTKALSDRRIVADDLRDAAEFMVERTSAYASLAAGRIVLNEIGTPASRTVFEVASNVAALTEVQRLLERADSPASSPSLPTYCRECFRTEIPCEVSFSPDYTCCCGISMCGNEICEFREDSSSCPTDCKDVATCDEQQVAGGNQPSTRQMNLARTSGTFLIEYNTFDVEDQIVIVDDAGVELFNSGCVGTNGTISEPVTFERTPGFVTISVEPNCRGGMDTAWEYTVNCP